MRATYSVALKSRDSANAARGSWIDGCGATATYNFLLLLLLLLKAVERLLAGGSLAECFGSWAALQSSRKCGGYCAMASVLTANRNSSSTPNVNGIKRAIRR